MTNSNQLDKIYARIGNLIQARKLREALEFINSALAEHPQDARLLFMLGCTYGELGMKEQAIDAYNKSAEFAGEMAANPLYNLANLYKTEGDFVNAIEAYQRVIKVSPTFADAWINLGCVLDDKGEHAHAVKCYDVALELNDQDPMPWSNRGNSLRSLLLFDQAEASYQRALELDADDVAALVGMGVCTLRRGDQSGLNLIEQAYATTRNPVVLFELATALASLARFDDALDCFDELVDSGMTNPEMWNNRGECLARLGKVDDALASFDEALKADCEYAPACFGKARVLINAGRDARTEVARLQQVAKPDFLEEPAVRALIFLSSEATEKEP